jgi:Recombination endonuclease VII
MTQEIRLEPSDVARLTVVQPNGRPPGIQRICALPDCDQPFYARSLCSNHYKWARLHGLPLSPPPPRRRCAVEDCARPYYSTGLCGMHYRRWKLHGDLDHKRVGRDEEKRAAYLRRYHAENPYYVRQYKLTVEGFKELLERQGGGCAICGATEPGGRTNSWHIDHDHRCCQQSRYTCGWCTRGILCSRCNVSLGAFRDDPTLLRRAAAYLEEGDMGNRDLHFDAAEMERLTNVCRALGTSRPEFVKWAVLQALDEVEGYGRDAAVVRAFYNGAS